MIIKYCDGNILDIEEDYIKYKVLKKNPDLHEILYGADEIILYDGYLTIIKGDKKASICQDRNIMGDYEVYKYIKKQPKELLEYMVKYGI